MIKLFCIPYAGGSAMVYNKWKRKTGSLVEVVPIELAGRGKRFTASPYDSFEASVNDIFDIVKDDIDDRKYAFFGHSMGSLLVYELVYKILENGLPMPIHLFLSGRYPPNVRDNGKIIHKLSDVNFKNAIREFGGTPEEVLENPELWDIFSPILRADYKILENYIYEPKPFKLYCDISILYGKSDKEVEQYDLSKWQDFTIGKCQVYKFDGGHFFIHEKMEKVISLIKSTLENYERD